MIVLWFGWAAAQTTPLAVLSTTSGDGQVEVGVDGYGSFGYQTWGTVTGDATAGDAVYDPVGATGPSTTSWESAIYLRLDGESTFLTTGEIGLTTPVGGLPDVAFTDDNGSLARSVFTVAGIEFLLRQEVRDVRIDGNRIGSVLIQSYGMRNVSDTALVFDLVRYYEGDLYLGGAGIPDGGGRLLLDESQEFVFETDVAGQPETSTNLIGITGCGGVIPDVGRFEVAHWPEFPDRIVADVALGDIVEGDGDDADTFVDLGLDYDVGIALANAFTLAPGARATYVTTTVFGTLPPEDAKGGCSGLVDDDGDGVADEEDVCPGFDDGVDSDADGNPNDCDPCPNDAADLCDDTDDTDDTDTGNEGDDELEPEDDCGCGGGDPAAVGLAWLLAPWWTRRRRVTRPATGAGGTAR